MGCFLVMMVVSGSRTNQMSYLSGLPRTDWLAAVANNQSYAAYVAASFHSEQNALQRDPIEWTNGPRASSQTEPLPMAKTNSLIQ
jgi:hypothetical protein